MKRKTKKKETVERRESKKKEIYWSFKQDKKYTREDALVRELAGIKILSDSEHNPLMIRI